MSLPRGDAAHLAGVGYGMKGGVAQLGAVQVVQHDYTPINTTKFYGNKQKNYPKKNWSSVMLFDCSPVRSLSIPSMPCEYCVRP